MGSLVPPPGQPPKYAQLYVFDPSEEAAHRQANFSGPNKQLLPTMMDGLQSMLDESNVLVQSFKRIRDSLSIPVNNNLRLRIIGNRISGARQYELPIGSELAGLVPDDFQPDREERDIIVNTQQTGLLRITNLNPKYDALHFSLLFPHGEDGFHLGIAYDPRRASKNRKRKHVTRRDYYCFRLQYRDSEGTTLVRGGKILQHFALTSGQQSKKIGFDTFVITKKNFAPMFTRVFWKLFNKETIMLLGGETSFCLPHLQASNIRCWAISAELHDPSIDPQGFSAVTRFMVHGPCGEDRPNSPCMDSGQCTKKFPKLFCSETTYDDDGYVTYKRRDTGIVVDSRGHIALVIASSAIAATLLPDVTTTHSHFRIPIEVHHTSTCMVKKGYKPFGGKTVLLGEDFCQTLPVITGGSRSDCLNANLTRSPLWPLCKLLRLSTNMRINSSPANSKPIFGDLLFAEWVLAIGDGTLAPPSGNGFITPNSVIIPQQFIVSPRYELIVSQLNDHIMYMVHGEPKTYFSLDTLVPEANASTTFDSKYPPEFLNSLSFNGVPEHAITLKEYTPIMILRNLNPSLGLCNGTRVLITKLCQYVIQGVVIGGFLEGISIALKLFNKIVVSLP
ncbi:hypothetical protein LINGRAHAP2_LOCUS20076 [Linum grandiflorum]